MEEDEPKLTYITKSKPYLCKDGDELILLCQDCQNEFKIQKNKGRYPIYCKQCSIFRKKQKRKILIKKRCTNFMCNKLFTTMNNKITVCRECRKLIKKS